MENLPEVQQQTLPASTERNGIVVCSYRPDDHAQKTLLLRAMVTSDYRAQEAIGSEISVQHVVAYHDEIVSEETGEVVPCVRTVLVDENGERLATVSQYAFRTVLQAIKVYGNPPWNPPHRFRMVERKSRKDRRYLILDPIS